MADPLRKVDGKLVFHEPLNPHFGYYYEVRRKLHSGTTRYQKIDLLDTPEFGHVLLLDNITQVAQKNDYQYHEPMVHPALCCHPRPEHVLVIGGGDGGILREVLKHRCVRSVAFAELDREVVEFSQKYLASINDGAFDSPKVQTEFGDGRAFVEANPGRFDIVIMDMTDPFGPSKMLYTREFFRAVKRSFRDAYGMFVMHAESPSSTPFAHNCVRKTLRSVFGTVRLMYLYVQMYATYWSVAVCSDDVDIAATPREEIDQRLRNRRLSDLQVYNGATHHAMQVEFPYIARIHRQKGEVITDSSPDFGAAITGASQ